MKTDTLKKHNKKKDKELFYVLSVLCGITNGRTTKTPPLEFKCDVV